MSNKVFSEINIIAETALLWSANPRAAQRPWTDKHTGRGQIPVFKKRALHSIKSCDKWTRDPLRTVELTPKEFEAVQLRRHDKDKARFLVESPIVSQCASEKEDAQETHAPLGPVLAEGDEIVFVNDMPAGDLSNFRPVTNRSQKITLMVRCPANDCAPDNHGLPSIWVNGRCKQARRIQTVIGRMLRGETLAIIDRACIQRIQNCPHFGAEGFEKWCKRQFPDIVQPLRQ